jgi:hypothetical protein
MKTSEFRKLAVILLLAITQTVIAGQEATKTFEKLFPLTGKASLEIDNRHGNIDIRNWEREEISVEVLVRVSHPNRETAERHLSYIDIAFSQVENAIKAITEIDQRFSRTGSRWFSGDSGQSISINYTVYAPKESALRISLRHGDIFINEATGHTFIDLRYGNLQANRIIRDNTRPLSEINLAYSTKATVSEADWLKVNMRYSDLSVDRCRALVITSSYSKVRVERASSIVAESRYGDFTLGELSNFVTESAYTNYTIRSVTNTLDVESRYGNVRISHIPAGFSRVRFVGSYGNLRAGVDPGASYMIESSAAYGSVSIPADTRANRSGSGRQSTITGIVGSAEKPSSRVEISTRYGNVDLTTR